MLYYIILYYLFIFKLLIEHAPLHQMQYYMLITLHSKV